MEGRGKGGRVMEDRGSRERRKGGRVVDGREGEREQKRWRKAPGSEDGEMEIWMRGKHKKGKVDENGFG